MRRRARLAVAIAGLVLAALAPAARAEDPGRWLLTGATSVPANYWQGLTSDPAKTSMYFVGVFEGLWQTDPALAPLGGVPGAIPPAVKQAEGYNHIGDPTWNALEGGRVVLPLEVQISDPSGEVSAHIAFGISDGSSFT